MNLQTFEIAPNYPPLNPILFNGDPTVDHPTKHPKKRTAKKKAAKKAPAKKKPAAKKKKK